MTALNLFKPNDAVAVKSGSPIKIEWGESEVAYFSYCSGIGEQIETASVIENAGNHEKWIQTRGSESKSEKIRLTSRVSAEHLKYFQKFSKIVEQNAKGVTQRKDALLYFDLDKGNMKANQSYEIAFKLKNAWPCLAEITNVSSDTSSYLVVEFQADEIIPTILWEDEIQNTDLSIKKQIGKNTASIEVKLVPDSKTLPSLYQDNMQHNLEVLEIFPKYLSASLSITVDRQNMKEELQGLLSPPGGSQLKVPNGSNLYDNKNTSMANKMTFGEWDVDLRRRREYLSIEFFVYRDHIGPFARNDDLLDSIQSLFYPAIYSTQREPSATANPPDMGGSGGTFPDYFVSQFAKNTAKGIDLPALHSKTYLPENLFVKIGSERVSSRPAIMKMYPHIVGLRLSHEQIFYGQIAHFNCEVDQFDRDGDAIRAKIRLGINGLRELNSKREGNKL